MSRCDHSGDSLTRQWQFSRCHFSVSEKQAISLIKQFFFFFSPTGLSTTLSRMNLQKCLLTSLFFPSWCLCKKPPPHSSTVPVCLLSLCPVSPPPPPVPSHTHTFLLSFPPAPLPWGSSVWSGGHASQPSQPQTVESGAPISLRRARRTHTCARHGGVVLPRDSPRRSWKVGGLPPRPWSPRRPPSHCSAGAGATPAPLPFAAHFCSSVSL